MESTIKACRQKLCQDTGPVKECRDLCKKTCIDGCKNEPTCMAGCNEDCTQCEDLRKQCLFAEKRKIIDCCKGNCKLTDYILPCQQMFCPDRNEACLSLYRNRINDCKTYNNRTCIGICDNPTLFLKEKFTMDKPFYGNAVMIVILLVVYYYINKN